MARLLTLSNPGRALPTIVILVIVVASLLFLSHLRDAGNAVAPGGQWNNGLDGIASFDTPSDAADATEPHPIDDLIRDAQIEHKLLLEKQSTTLAEAATRYRERRGRHPPPGFDTWYAAAEKSKAIVVEDFFDRIYHDLTPLWALNPAEMRRKTHKQPHVIRVRNGKIIIDSEPESKESSKPPYRVRQWAKLVGEMMPHLPDLDMSVNVMDESRIMAPWEKVNEYVAAEQKKRAVIPRDQATSEYSGLKDIDEAKPERYEPNWTHDPVTQMWNFVAAACPPDSPARKTKALDSLSEPVSYPRETMPYMYHGYVRNFTSSQDPCAQPHLRAMHGTFTEPVSMAVTTEYLPLFGECKLATNNELLIPGAVYLDDARVQYSGGRARGSAWAAKRDQLIWRGVSSGARNKPHNWWHIHRHRFIQMLNGTTVAAVEAGDTSLAKTFDLMPPETYHLAAQKAGALGPWVASWSAAGFTDVFSEPDDFTTHWWYGRRRTRLSHWMAPFFSILPEVPMKEQYTYKYLPDVDGQTFSGRYRAFLLSTSAVLKSTIYAEWHDSRLVPWVHFIPFDTSYMDIYGVMDYFLRGHDAAAQRIAEESKAWAESVLRREDMRLYTWRLLLEYARVVDDKRDTLAFVGDLET